MTIWAEAVEQQGRLDGTTSANGWAGAAIQKPPTIRAWDGQTDGPTNRHSNVMGLQHRRGRGRAHFTNFRLVLTDGATNGRTDKATYGVASSRLKLTNQ